MGRSVEQQGTRGGFWGNPVGTVRRRYRDSVYDAIRKSFNQDIYLGRFDGGWTVGTEVGRLTRATTNNDTAETNDTAAVSAMN